MSSSSRNGRGPIVSHVQGTAGLTQQSTSGERSRRPQARQLLSCTKCRDRKVKCDRINPCSACCARGQPKECEFVVEEGSNYSQIQQSYEIKKLRAENQRLKELLQTSRSNDEGDDGELSERKVQKMSSRAIVARQRRFKTGDRVDNLYFGTPGLANIIHDFANLHIGSESLTHTMPKARDMYVFSSAVYPFFTLWSGPSDEITAKLVGCLPAEGHLYEIVELFQRRAQSYSFPHTPDEVTKNEIGRFLSDVGGNAQRYPDMLALIFATLATGLQMGQYDRSGGQWVAEDMKSMKSQADVYLAASMQALRMASFMSNPTLLGIQALVMIGPYLTNTGRFLDAWTLFGTTIRIAHSMGLHRDPRLLQPPPPLRECVLRQTLWWWMLHMDQQYSVTLGRPLGISGFGDCPPPEPFTTNPSTLRLGEFVDHFTILAREILSSNSLMSVTKTDEFTDKLIGLWDTMPEALQFNESWLRQSTNLPDWPLEVMSATLFAKVQSFLILLNRQRIERTKGLSGEASPSNTTTPQPSFPEPLMHSASLRGRALVINSAIHLLHTFLFFHHRQPAVLICWTIGQQAFNASMILILDAWEMENEQNEWLVDQAYAVFAGLVNKGVHELAEIAVQRISDGLMQLGNRRTERKRQAAMSLRPSTHQTPTLTMDTASLMNWSADAVMGNTGMFLLEDPGYQSLAQPAFQPLGWNIAGSAPSLHQPNPPTLRIPSPIIPPSQIIPTPFPTMSPAYLPNTIPTTNSPYAIGFQPRIPHQPRRPSTRQTQSFQSAQAQQAAFTPINHIDLPREMQRQLHTQVAGAGQPSFLQLRGPRPIPPGQGSQQPGGSANTGAGVGSRSSSHRLDRPPPRSWKKRAG